MNKTLLAFTLGDGYLDNRGTLKITHCEKQKEYLEYKAKIFDANILYKLNNKFPAYYFSKGTFNNKWGGKEIRKKLYGVMNHKYYSKTIVKEMDKYCFAILYCDDGGLFPKKKNGKITAYNMTISTYCSYEECERLQKRICELFNVNFHIIKDKNKYLLRCGTREARKFLIQIKPLIPLFECFKDNKLKDI